MKQLSTYTDAALVHLYRTELNAEFAGELYKRYSLPVFGLSYKYLRNEENAKDAVSDIFELILDKLKTHEVTFFSSWLFIVSKNHLMRLKYKNKPDETTDIENIPEKFMQNVVDVSLNIQESESVLLRDALKNLNGEQLICIELFYFRQKPYREIAYMTGYDLGKVKSCIQNGKRNLRMYMEENKPHYE